VLTDFEERAPSEIAERLDLLDDAPRSWMALVPATRNGELQSDLTSELSAILERPVRVLPLAVPIEKLSESLHEPSDDVVVLIGSPAIAVGEWSTMDMNRSRLEREGPAILWLSPEQVSQMSQYAPNIKSYVGGSIFRVTPDEIPINESDRKRRLEELSDQYGWSNQELISRASSGGLTSEPEIAEWLVLLGRGDLI
jgi:hypothetical protein